MIKSQLIEAVAHKLPTFQARDVEMCINHIIECMSEALTQGKRIELRGFGSFSLHYHPPRQAHNPKTGELITTEGKFTPHFKPGKELRERVDKNHGQPLIDCLDEDE